MTRETEISEKEREGIDSNGEKERKRKIIGIGKKNELVKE